MKLSNNRLWMFILLISSFFILTSCDGGGGGGDSSSHSSQTTTTLELGTTATLGSITVDANGSLLTVESPDATMNGLEINVPPGAYQGITNFTISYSPIISHSGNENLDPVTPLISIENGGEYADEIITVKIPVTIEDGYHYMAFYYDEATGGLEGIPEVEHDETSLTIATRHFSKILLNRLGYEVTIGTYTVDSGFQVTKDNWQFENPGTYLSPGGICSGMSIASLYYYNEKKKKQAYPLLYGLYDNGTSSLDIDDDQAIKLCSQAQVGDGGFDARSVKVWHEINKQKGDVWTYFLFIHSILLTGEPQYVSIYTPDDKSGHALVVYKKSGNDLYVADPNFPKDATVKIEFDWSSDPSATDPSSLTGQFKPIQSQLNKDTGLINFTQVYYIGKTSVMDWNKLKDLWDELENETVGKDFPDYDLKIIEKDASGTEREYALTDGYKTNNSVVKVKVETFEFVPKINVFYEQTGALDNHSDIVEVTLKSGDNELGFLIESELLAPVTLDSLGWTWVDFKYINIKLDKEDTPTEASISVTNTLDVDVDVFIDDQESVQDYNMLKLKPGQTFTPTCEPGTYKITVSYPKTVAWTRVINLDTGQNYVYDFEASDDCSAGKVTIFNNTSDNGKLSYFFKDNNNVLRQFRVTMDANEKKDIYLSFTWATEFYLRWDTNETNWFTPDCSGHSWTVTSSSGPVSSGTP